MRNIKARECLARFSAKMQEETNALLDVNLLRSMGLPDHNPTLVEKIATYNAARSERVAIEVEYDTILGLTPWRGTRDGI